MMSQSIKICVVDDDEIYQFYAHSLLTNQGQVGQVLQFFDGQEAIDFFLRNSQHADLLPHLVLLDLEMPYQDGWQFLDQYRKLHLARPVILYVVSSSASPTDRERALRHPNVTGYITKPMTTQQFNEVLSSLEDPL